MVKIKRVYAAPEADDGERILVDRLWPRGLSKERAAVALWLKDVAPSTELRKWFGHDPARWDEFRRRYADELDHRPEAVAQLRRALGAGPATLVYGAKDTAHNDAVVLAAYMEARP